MFDSSTPHDDGVLREDGSHGSESCEGDPRAAAMVPSSAQFPLTNPGPLANPSPLANSGGFGFEPEAADDEGTRLSLAALLRAKWLIFGVFVVVSALGIPPVWKFVVPKYSATATVWVRPVMPQLVFKIDDGTSSRNFAGYFNTVMAYFTNPTVLQGVLERPDVRKTAWYDEAPHTLGMMLGGAAPGRISRLLSDIKVTNRRKTELIDIEFSALHACDTRVIVNALVEEFMRLTKEADRAAQAEKFSALLSEKANLEGGITELEDKVGELSKKLGTNDPDIVRAQLATQLGELQMERQRFQRSYEMLLWAMESKSKAPKEVGTVTDEGLARFANDREWARLNEQLAGARHKLATARSRYGEAHPVIQELRADVAYAKDRLKQRETILADASLDSGAGAGSGTGASADVASGSRTDLLFLPEATLQRKAKQSKRELEILDAQIERLLREQEAKGELAKQVAQLSGELNRKHGVYEEVVSTIQRIEVERDAPGRISVRALAIEPTEPARDRRILYTLAVLGFGLACGVTVAHLRYAMDPKVHEAGELQQGVRVPFLGQLPALPGAQLLASACSPLMAECMRIIRTALLERFRGVDRGVVLITSATSSAGKTTVALELSRSLAHLGKKTLLVEADLRRPRLGERMGVEEGAGLAALLAGEATHRQVIKHTTDERLDVVYAGQRSESFDPELLANGIFAECLAKWRKAYDFVMIDSPPILPVADSRILAGHVDGTIMVSRSSHCKRADVVQACADLSAAGSPLLGTVLVGAQTGAGYGYSYEYSSR